MALSTPLWAYLARLDTVRHVESPCKNATVTSDMSSSHFQRYTLATSRKSSRFYKISAKYISCSSGKIRGLIDTRVALERFFRRMNAELSFGTCEDQILTTYGRLIFARRSMSNAERPDPVITVVRSMDGSRRLAPIP